MHQTELDGGRGADWRFLLPISTRDEVVIETDPRPEDLERAFAAVPRGGVCYFEWRSRLRPSARSARRRLEAAGFARVRLYWSWPREVPSVWLPLEAPVAARWVLRRKHRTAAARLWRVANAAQLLRPRCATAVRPPAGDDAGPLGVGLGELGGEPFWALLAPGGAPLNKVLAFVGIYGRDDPVLVLKMPRTDAAKAPLEREARALEALQTAEIPPPGIPRLLFREHGDDGVRAIAESPLEGRPLFELLDRRHHAALARRATDWLVELARSGAQPAGPRTAAVDLAADIAAVAAPTNRDLIVEAGRVASGADSMPIVFEQRDFSPWNVHVGPDGDLVVFDWESAEPAGFPTLDLVYLLTYCNLFLEGAHQSGRALQSYRATFEGSVARECLARYCGTLGIDREHLPALRTLTWLIHLGSALHRDPDGADAALFRDLLREEVR